MDKIENFLRGYINRSNTQPNTEFTVYEIVAIRLIIGIIVYLLLR